MNKSVYHDISYNEEQINEVIEEFKKKSVYRKIPYNEKRINEVIENFKKKKLKPSDIQIGFDMDNSICLFSNNGDDETALKLMWNKNYYRNLPCFSEAPAVIEVLQKIGFRVLIITSCIPSEYCKREKIEWIHYHLPSIKDEDIILVENGTKKTDYIENVECTILIDDYYKNIMDWYDAGGIAIKKTFSGKKRPVPQVNSLVELFNILIDLGLLNPNP